VCDPGNHVVEKVYRVLLPLRLPLPPLPLTLPTTRAWPPATLVPACLVARIRGVGSRLRILGQRRSGNAKLGAGLGHTCGVSVVGLDSAERRRRSSQQRSVASVQQIELIDRGSGCVSKRCCCGRLALRMGTKFEMRRHSRKVGMKSLQERCVLSETPERR